MVVKILQLVILTELDVPAGKKKTDLVTYRTDHENEFSKILTKYIKKNTRFWLAENERIFM